MEPLVIIAGPTAVGKSALAVKLAKRINGSIISCDSMQVYKKMDIGTAKISEEEKQGIAHYLIDVLDPTEDFNIVLFKQLATKAINDIRSDGKIPIMTGGTGFYIQSVLYDIDFDETGDDPVFRSKISDLIAEEGGEYVHKMLEDIDPDAAKAIHFNDERRMIRALEYYEQTGNRISDHNRINSDKKSIYNHCYFFIEDDRQKIYERIDRRVDDMIKAGLVDEVKGLMSLGLTKDHVSMHGLGYKEIIDHLEGNISLEDAIYKIKRDSRHFAKRQITWSKREPDIIRIDIGKCDDAVEVMIEVLSKKGIIDGQSL